VRELLIQTRHLLVSLFADHVIHHVAYATMQEESVKLVIQDMSKMLELVLKSVPRPNMLQQIKLVKFVQPNVGSLGAFLIKVSQSVNPVKIFWKKRME
jgi:uncharacterized membrane protein